MWHLVGIGFDGGLGSAGLAAGLDELREVFSNLNHSMILCRRTATD